MATSTLAVSLTLLTGCGLSNESTPAAEVPATASTASEADGVRPRLVLTHDGGITVLDATNLQPVANLDLPGFNRVNPAGDGRHVLVSTTGGFRVLDAGTWAEPHGDHAHYYTAAPRLTDVTHPAKTPGHVVAHDGRTALFDDGIGQVLVADSETIGTSAGGARRLTTPSASMVSPSSSAVAR